MSARSLSFLLTLALLAAVQARAAADAPQARAEALVQTAKQTGTVQASRALAEIAHDLETPPSIVVFSPPPPVPRFGSPGTSAPMVAAATSLPRGAARYDALAQALLERKDRIVAAALAQFAASASLDEGDASVAIQALASATQCTRAGCDELPAILARTDRLPARLALEASHLISIPAPDAYRQLRRRQYALPMALLAGAAALLLAMGLYRRIATLASAGCSALIVVAGALLIQYSHDTGLPAVSWPPLTLWLGTPTGLSAMTLLTAVIAGSLAPRFKALTAALTAEGAWFSLPVVLALVGVNMKMQHYSDEGWTWLFANVLMVLFGPLLAAVLVWTARNLSRLMLRS